jgi:hypothetical protein
MGRPVTVRASYRDDASFLIRLEKAVEADDRKSSEWRTETCRLIRALAVRFLEADESLSAASEPRASSPGQPKKK